MEVLKAVQKKLQLKNFHFEDPDIWCGIPYVWGSYYYSSNNRTIAKYIFLHIDINSWQTVRSTESQFVSDIIENAFYSLNNDLRWNIYLICIVSDHDFAGVDRYEKRLFENNTKYTRNYLLSESMIETRIPIGKVLMGGGQQIIYPIEEWQNHLGKYSFCMRDFTNDPNFGKLVKSQLSRQSFLDKELAPLDMQEIRNINIPKKFRPHIYKKDWIFPCEKFNLLFGDGGTGKTSVLSAIELCITGSVYKPPKYTEDSSNQSKVSLSVLKQDETTIIEKPQSSRQIRARERKWYNCYNEESKGTMGTRLNSLFHRFNYFSVEEPYQFASSQPEINNLFAKQLYGIETWNIWNNIQNYRNKCEQIMLKLNQEYQSIKVQMEPPKVDNYYEYQVWDCINEAGLKVTNDTLFSEVLVIVATLQNGLKKLEKPIVSKREARSTLSKIDDEIHICQSKEIRLSRRIELLRHAGRVVDAVAFLKPKTEHKIFELEGQKEENEKRRLKLLREKERIKEIADFWERMSRWIVDNNDCLSGEKLETQCKKIQNAITEFNQFQDYTEKYPSLEKREKEVSGQLLTYKKIHARLTELKPPQEYAEAFINNNISQISKIFINLHTPQEFSELKIIDSEIVGVRNGEEVPLANMSTSQRRTLVFSVFFQLHLSNPSAPPFLLFDEPTAHIDPLNSLLLMDFLRELVITYDRQLFVTTNNRNTANLFRRKFSFLDERLQEISFYRGKKDSCEIRRRTFNQQGPISDKEL